MHKPIPSFKVLDDAPAVSDDFHSHEKIATTIREIIGRNDGGMTIGLEGEWGSGKSTIIKILQDRCEVDRTTHFFNFDAWVHQGDPLRRAFLEGLISKAIDNGWLGDKTRTASDDGKVIEKWIGKRAALSAQVRTVVTNKEPEIASLHKLLLLSLLLAPAGSALSISMLTKSGLNPFSWPLSVHGSLLVTGIALAILPALFLVFGLLFSGSDRTKRKTIWSVFLQKSHVSETVHTIESLDTSTIEFQGLFKEFMDDLLNDETRKLVIVLDNLDRLPADEGAEAWPVLRSFIDNPTFATSSWFKRLWILIPYARNALALPEKQAGDGANVENKGSVKAGEAAPQKTMSPHFLDKVFQIKIFVPPPVLSNWRTYLEKQLKKAFGEQCDASACHTIYLLFARCYGVTNTPGPREIKNIINSMVSTAIQWPADIPLTHHAYFAILKHGQRIDNLRVRLLGKTIELHTDLLGHRADESLVALEYNVPLKMASQMLYEPFIRNIFSRQSDGAELLEHCEDPGFAARFDILIGTILEENAGSPELFIHNLAVLCKNPFLAQIAPSSKGNIIRELAKAFNQLSYLPLHVRHLVTIIESLIEVDVDKSTAAGLSNAIERTCRHFSEEKNRSIFGFSDQNLGNMQVLELAHELKSSQLIKDFIDSNAKISFKFPGDASKFLNACKFFAKKDNPWILDVFDFASVRENFTHEIVLKSGERRMSETIDIIEFLSNYGAPVKPTIYNTLVARMFSDRSVGFHSVQVALPYFLGLLQEEPLVKKALTDPSSLDFAYFYLSIYNPRLPANTNLPVNDVWFVDSMSKADKAKVCGMLMYLLALNGHVSSAKPSGDQTAKGKQFYDRILACPQRYPRILGSFCQVVSTYSDIDSFQDHPLRAKLGALHADADAALTPGTVHH